MRTLWPNCARLAALAAAVLALGTDSAHAWGLLGHRIVAETAALLMREHEHGHWGRFLARHRFELGYYSAVPDHTWRHTDGAKGETEGPTHFFDIDLVAKDAKGAANLPVDYREFVKFAESNQDSRAHGAEKIGSSPWRVEQFTRLIRKTVASKSAPDAAIAFQGGYQSGSRATGSNQALYETVPLLGELSHYTGDATMPYHSVKDYNGWAIGQGGIHFYLESDCVDALEPGIAPRVRDLALKMRREWTAQWGLDSSALVRSFQRVAWESATQTKRAAALDRKHALLERSRPEDEATMRFAKRRPAAQGCVGMKDFLIERLARGAVVTEFFWRAALPAGADFSRGEHILFNDIVNVPAYIAPDYR